MSQSNLSLSNHHRTNSAIRWFSTAWILLDAEKLAQSSVLVKHFLFFLGLQVYKSLFHLSTVPSSLILKSFLEGPSALNCWLSFAGLSELSYRQILADLFYRLILNPPCCCWWKGVFPFSNLFRHNLSKRCISQIHTNHSQTIFNQNRVQGKAGEVLEQAVTVKINPEFPAFPAAATILSILTTIILRISKVYLLIRTVA